MLGSLRLLSTKYGLDASTLMPMCRKAVDIEDCQIAAPARHIMALHSSLFGAPDTQNDPMPRLLIAGIARGQRSVDPSRPM
jgi:hypothetical protein